jgi:molybdopterin-guanine dinucleotide biosynthesis protein A
MALGVVLAGGSSNRMRTDKALVEIAGRSMVEWVVGALSAVCDSVIVAGREGHLAGYRCLPDAWPGVHGPLAGLATALELDEQLIVVGVDQPFVRVDTLRRLAAEPGTAVPFDEQRQVTCATYAPSCRVEAGREADDGGSIQSLLDRLPHRTVEEPEWRSWGEDGRSWFSVDSPEDLAEGLARWGTPGG